MGKKGGLNNEETGASSIAESLFGMGNNDLINEQIKNQAEIPSKEEKSVIVEKVVDTKSQEEIEKLKKQIKDKDEKINAIKQEKEALKEMHEVEKKEQEEKIKKLEERKPAGRHRQYEADLFTKYSLNIRKEFLLYMQTYAQATRQGQVALVFDDAIKKFIDSVSKEDTEAIKYALRKQGKDYDSLFNNLIKG